MIKNKISLIIEKKINYWDLIPRNLKKKKLILI